MKKTKINLNLLEIGICLGLLLFLALVVRAAPRQESRTDQIGSVALYGGTDPDSLPVRVGINETTYALKIDMGDYLFNLFIPYKGATQDGDMGIYNFTAANLYNKTDLYNRAEIDAFSYISNLTAFDTDDLLEGSTNKYANTTAESHGETAYGWGAPRGFGMFIGNGTANITTGFKFAFVVPYDLNATEWSVLSCDNETPSIGNFTMDIWKGTYADYPLNDTYAITNSSTAPQISSSDKGYNASPEWDTLAFSSGDVLSGNVTACDGITKVFFGVKGTP